KQKKYAMPYNQEVKNSQRAELSFKYLTKTEEGYLLEVKPVTGRFHQIRAQLSKIGCRIVGDLKYGAPAPNPDKSICLHAYKLNFVHPIKNEPIEIIAELPEKPIWINARTFLSENAF
ncbi:MAG: RNA pseudouridine synthase, partial [Bacteroidota bacterium]|nr:RNA pseudouridine synthase [Bacteroidota bacterium]